MKIKGYLSLKSLGEYHDEGKTVKLNRDSSGLFEMWEIEVDFNLNFVTITPDSIYIRKK